MTEEESTGFKVSDKRRFHADGALKSDKSEVEEMRNQETKQFNEQMSETQRPENADLARQEGSDIRFSSFVMSLATQALIQLGEMEPPPGLNLPIDKAQAKQTIDILSMLEEKTKTNLTKDEEELLRELLHNLRMAFVRAK